ncbi:MAG: haloalkane dehalogenase [Chloroflexi bacterium]|nr:haloalkane dehalogenase [Chloroflexota bacterium]
MGEQEISAAFPYESRFVEVAGSRIHYVEEGSGDPVLFLHGNPTSSYLWRNIMPYAARAGRAIAMDLIGMGKSDKLDLEYRFVDHARYVDGFIEQLGLRNITFVVHDWGSALGFHYARRHEANVKGLAFMEAIYRPFTWAEFPEQARGVFQGFRTPETGWDMVANRNMFVELVLPSAIVRKLSDEEMARYREPFPTPESRKPVWRWPNEIPIDGEPEDVHEIATAYWQWLQETDVPKIVFAAQPGALIRAEMLAELQAKLKNLTVVDIGPGLHFVQEDSPHTIGEALLAWYRGL